MEPRAYGPFPYLPITERPELKWPGGARIALWVAPNIEFFPLDEKVFMGNGLVPDVLAWSHREYGNRVGIWRIMEVLDRYGVDLIYIGELERAYYPANGLAKFDDLTDRGLDVIYENRDVRIYRVSS